MSQPVQVQIIGMDRVQAAIRAFGQEVMDGVEQAIEASALEALTDVRKAIQGPPKTGRLYKRGKKVHRASAPGEAPATDMGALVNSTYYTKPDPFTAEIGSRLDYAFFLEFGSRKTAKRPAWLPAAERAAPRLQRRIEKVIRAAKAKAENRTT